MLAADHTRHSGAPSGVSSHQLLGAARGLAFVFWGVGAALLLAGGVVEVGPDRFRDVPWHAAGLVVLAYGASSLRRLQPLAPSWTRWSGLLVAAALLQLYFVPFTTWWIHRPTEDWYVFNMFLLLLATLGLLSAVNRVVASVGEALADRNLVIKARLCEGASAFFILGPALALFFFTLVLRYRQEEAGLQVTFHDVRTVWTPWTLFFCAIPFLLTMASAWDGKEACLRRLRKPAKHDP